MTSRWLVELERDDESTLHRRLESAGAAPVPTFRPTSLPAARGGAPTVIMLVELAPADAARVRALPGFLGMVPDLALAPVDPTRNRTR